MKKHIIDVDMFIPASPELVYGILSDHPNLDQFKEVSCSELSKEGDNSPHGAGAVRKVTVRLFGALPICFTENMIVADAPTKITYSVPKVKVALGPLSLWAGVKHYGGEIKVVAEKGGCHVYWTAALAIQIPLVNGLAGGILRKEGERVYTSFLEQIKTSLAQKDVA